MKKIFWRNSMWMDQPLHAFKRVLDVGAGGVRRADFVTTMDIRTMENTDVVHNANQFPWPFKDDSFDYIILSNVLEHVDDVRAVLDEIYRITANHGVVRIICPHFTNPCSFVDVTHTRALSALSLDVFCNTKSVPFECLLDMGKKILGCDMGVDQKFRESKFKLLRRSIYFREALWWTLVPVWGNLFQEYYEVYLSRILPGWAIHWELKVTK